MTGDTTTHLCPKCKCKLLWNGKHYCCVACDFTLDPKARRSSGAEKPPKRPKP